MLVVCIIIYVLEIAQVVRTLFQEFTEDLLVGVMVEDLQQAISAT